MKNTYELRFIPCEDPTNCRKCPFGAKKSDVCSFKHTVEASCMIASIGTMIGHGYILDVIIRLFSFGGSKC